MKEINKNNWIWMPHPAHFCEANKIKFNLATYINGFIISTIGEYQPFKEGKNEALGINRLYETMVFEAEKSINKCCPYQIKNGIEEDMKGYNDAGKAVAGHMEFCIKYSLI